jgi:hypothetical protein
MKPLYEISPVWAELKVFDICRPDFCVRTGDVEMGGDKGIILFKIL